ncbi:MAG: serine/threonine protein kinase [Chloroflexia bacterium]|nr:serine/threonine protein kinase [Chloroflexia bacterium]
MLRTGTVIKGRYRIARLLGAGGMGAVYRAWDLNLQIAVALKEMLPQPDMDQQALAKLKEQFRCEARILAELSRPGHPNLVRVTDSFEEGGNAYLIMDFVDGQSLDEKIEQFGALPLEQVQEWLQQLLGALHYCHQRGVLHRDIKPANIIIRPDGQAVLVDFGLVKLWDPSNPETQTVIQGSGTPEYAPLEQYDLAHGYTDPRSDIYGLGATFYHALTGQAPPSATWRAVESNYLTPLRQINPQVSSRMEAVILKAMALQPSERFQTMPEMAQALHSKKAVRVKTRPPKKAQAREKRPSQSTVPPPQKQSRPAAKQPAKAKRPLDDWAIVSPFMGLISNGLTLVFWRELLQTPWSVILGFALFALLSISIGSRTWRRIKKSGGKLSGGGFAASGVVLGSINALLVLINYIGRFL